MACVAASAFQFLSVWPDNAALLLDAARRSTATTRFRTETPRALRRRCEGGRTPKTLRIASAGTHPMAGRRRRRGSESDARLDPRFLRSVQGGQSRARLGVDSPIVGACRTLLDKRPGPFDQECLQIFAEAARNSTCATWTALPPPWSDH